MDLTKFDRHYFLQFMKLDFHCKTFHGLEEMHAAFIHMK